MRTYGSGDIIALPKLSTAAAVALGQGLLTAARAKGEGLPELVSSRLQKLEAAYGELHQAMSQNQQIEPDPQRARQADLAEDQAWSAFHDWLTGWGKLSGTLADTARTMYAVLFPARLKFTRLPYKLEWAEADARLARIVSDGFGAQIEALGGTPILEHLRETHRTYGEVLGITAEAQNGAALGLREPLEAFLARLRGYVLAVAAHADEEDAESGALTDSLLAPLLQWQSRQSESPAADEGGELDGAAGDTAGGQGSGAGGATDEPSSPGISGVAASSERLTEDAG